MLFFKFIQFHFFRFFYFIVFILFLVLQGFVFSAEVDDLLLSKNMWDCQSFALEHHSSIHLAQDELNLSEARKQESFRTLFPSLNLKAEQTDGKADSTAGTPDFREQSYGLVLNQPIFQGGKVFYTYAQNRAQFESLYAKYEKTKLDVLFDVEESYWQWVRAYRVLQIYKNALTDLEIIYQQADSLYGKGILTRQSYLIVLGQRQQGRIQLESAEVDLEARLWQWTAALGLDLPPGFRPKPLRFELSEKMLSLVECLEQVGKKHPEIDLQEKTMQAAEYGLKAAKSYFLPRLDLNSTYGKSAAAFKTESLRFQEDWQVQVRVTVPLGWNSANVSGIRQKTSPRLGQSSRTQIETFTGTLSLLDSLKDRTQEREALFLMHQANDQLHKIKVEVRNRVRQMYADMKKAQLHWTMTENDFKLAQTDFEVAKIKGNNQPLSLSEIMVARNKQAQAEVAWAEAQVQFAIATAALNRAMGIQNLFSLKILE